MSFWKVQGKQKGIILNGPHQRLFEADVANLMSENINTAKKNEVDLDVNA
jgi:hypothetical protein